MSLSFSPEWAHQCECLLADALLSVCLSLLTDPIVCCVRQSHRMGRVSHFADSHCGQTLRLGLPSVSETCLPVSLPFAPTFTQSCPFSLTLHHWQLEYALVVCLVRSLSLFCSLLHPSCACLSPRACLFGQSSAHYRLSWAAGAGATEDWCSRVAVSCRLQ